MANHLMRFKFALWILALVCSICLKTDLKGVDATLLSKNSVKLMASPPEDTNRITHHNVILTTSKSKATSTIPVKSNPLSREIKSRDKGTQYGEIADKYSDRSNTAVRAKPNKPSIFVVPQSTSGFDVLVATTSNLGENLAYFASLEGGQEKQCTIEGEDYRACEFGDLAAGKTYKVKARACRQIEGPSDCSDYTERSAWTRPNPPHSVRVTKSTSSSVTVEATPPDIKSGISYYEVLVPKGKPERCQEPLQDPIICKITGLSPGTQHSVIVEACIDGAPNTFCSQSEPGSGYTKPNEPQDVRVEPKSTESIVVTFTAPADTTGITYYEVILDDNPPQKIDSTQNLSYEISGLEAGTRHRVTMRSCIGKTDPLVCSDNVEIFGWTKPNKPSSVTVKLNTSTSVIVDVAAPGVDTGIGYYLVDVEGGELTKSCKIPSLGTLSCQVQNLKPGTEYAVAAQSCIHDTGLAICNGKATGSGWTRPETPQSVTVESQSKDSVVVNFKAPTDTTGIAYYEVILDDNPPQKIDSTQNLPHEIPGLEAGTQYVVKVRACVDKANPVVYSEDVIIPGWTKPDAPQNVAVEKVYPRSVFVVWSKPTGNKDIKSYQALAMETTGEVAPSKEFMCLVEAPSSNLECSIEGLSPSTNYSISVRACMPDGTCGAAAGADKLTTCQDSPNYALIISLLVVFFVIIIVIILVVMFFKRRKWRTNAKNYDNDDFPTDLKTIVDVKKN